MKNQELKTSAEIHRYLPGDKLTVLSYGGGQDSTALLYKLAYDADFKAKYAPGDLLVVMSDTGNEHDTTIKTVEEIKTFCKAQAIEFTHITADMGYHSKSWQSLKGFYRLKNAIGSKAFPKTCTDNLKIQPIYKYLEEWIGNKYGFETGRKKAFKQFAARYGKVKVLVGIAAGEEKRVMDPAKNPSKWHRETVEMLYPLIDLGMDRQGCQDYIKSVGHNVPTPSNCVLCPFMNLVELLWLYRFQPADFNEWVELENNKIQANLHMGDRNLGVWGRKLLPTKLVEAQEKHGRMSNQELSEYKMSHGHCVKSKY